MRTVKISDLEVSTKLPSDDELVCPVYLDHTDHVLRKVKISDIANIIKETVAKGGGVEMVETETGVKFLPCKPGE